VEERKVNARSHRLFHPVDAAFELRVRRPSPRDEHVLLCVAGTYTSPSDRVEGVVVLDGGVIQTTRMAWQGLLTITAGNATVERATPAAFSPKAFSQYASAATSLVQGHLLVDAARPTPLKPSPALHRRAVVTREVTPGQRTSFVVESLEPVELAAFAADLAALGASTAFNLDMGSWSEGWYRDESGVHPLGHDRSSTARQSNWLVIVRRGRSQ